MRLRYTLLNFRPIKSSTPFLTLYCFFFPPLAQKIGCFKDTSRRAIPQLDGKSRLIRGYYKRRKFAIQNCILAAVQRGYRMIGVQDGGWCASGPRAQRTFSRYEKEFRSGEGVTLERAAFLTFVHFLPCLLTCLLTDSHVYLLTYLLTCLLFFLNFSLTNLPTNLFSTFSYFLTFSLTTELRSNLLTFSLSSFVVIHFLT